MRLIKAAVLIRLVSPSTFHGQWLRLNTRSAEDGTREHRFWGTAPLMPRSLGEADASDHPLLCFVLVPFTFDCEPCALCGTRRMPRSARACRSVGTLADSHERLKNLHVSAHRRSEQAARTWERPHAYQCSPRMKMCAYSHEPTRAALARRFSLISKGDPE